MVAGSLAVVTHRRPLGDRAEPSATLRRWAAGNAREPGSPPTTSDQRASRPIRPRGGVELPPDPQVGPSPGSRIHYGSDARNECPTLADDEDDNGHLNTSEGAPAYGEIVVSLTKTGDTSPDSGPAVERIDSAKGGEINYERGSIKVSEDVAEDILSGESAVVIHGVDYNDDGEYSGDEKSDLNPDLPTEATDPALCGVLSNAPHGGMETGVGGAAGGQNTALLALGGGALLAAAGSGVLTARRVRNQA